MLGDAEGAGLACCCLGSTFAAVLPDWTNRGEGNGDRVTEALVYFCDLATLATDSGAVGRAFIGDLGGVGVC